MVKQLEESTGSVVVGQIGRSVILYRPSVTKLKAEEKRKQARRVYVRKGAIFKPKLPVNHVQDIEWQFIFCNTHFISCYWISCMLGKIAGGTITKGAWTWSTRKQQISRHIIVQQFFIFPELLQEQVRFFYFPSCTAWKQPSLSQGYMFEETTSIP